MNNLYNYFDKIVKNDKLSHSFLIGNVKYDDIKNELYKVFNNFIFNSDIDNEINPDLYVIKSEKGNISKESVKKLLNEISTTSQFCNNKIYVIDSAEKLNEYSYNAILKTLEEPKDNIYAFLITSNINSIKDTIKSRCQKIFISSEINMDIENDEVKEIALKIFNYIEDNNLKTISNYYQIYNDIENRDNLNLILRELLNIYFEQLNKYIENDNINMVDLFSKKIIIINESINELNSYLNKNLSIDRFIIKMWRCTNENS